MLDFTDFIVWVNGGQVLEFRHSANSVHELWLVQDEIIFDIYGSQGVRRSDIRMIHLDPRPYFKEFYRVFGYIPQGYRRELWDFINKFSQAERDKIKADYYKEIDGSTGVRG